MEENDGIMTGHVGLALVVAGGMTGLFLKTVFPSFVADPDWGDYRFLWIVVPVVMMLVGLIFSIRGVAFGKAPASGFGGIILWIAFLVGTFILF